jgi:hypothetical protein
MAIGAARVTRAPVASFGVARPVLERRLDRPNALPAPALRRHANLPAATITEEAI